MRLFCFSLLSALVGVVALLMTEFGATASPGSEVGAYTQVEDFSSYARKAAVRDAEWDVFSQRLTLSPMSGLAHRESAVASDGQGGAYVAWSDLRNNSSNGNWDVYVQHVDTYGNRLWPADLRINTDATTTYQGAPSIAADQDGNAVIVWFDDREEPHAAYAQKIAPDGARLWPSDVRVNHALNYRIGWGSDAMDVAIDAQGNAVVAWQGTWGDDWDPDVYTQKLSPTGQRLWPADVRVNEDAGYNQLFMSVGTDTQGYITVAWTDDRNGGEDIYAQRLDPAGNRQWTADVKVSSGGGVAPQNQPDVVLDSHGDAVIVWCRGPVDPPLDDDVSLILAQKVGPDGTLRWAGEAQVHEDASHVYRGKPSAALGTGDRVMVVWEDARRGFDLGTVDMFAQLLDRDGTRALPEDWRINPEDWKNWNLRPSLYIAGGRAWVAWETDDDIYAHAVNVDTLASLTSIPARVNENSGEMDQFDADVVVLDDGRLLVAWHAAQRDNRDIRIQILDRNGEVMWPVGLQVSDTAVRIKRQWLQVARNAGGFVLIVWQDEQGGVYGQMIGTEGYPIWAGELRVDRHGLRSQNPSAAALSDGSFVVAWLEQSAVDAGVWDVYMQRLDTSGNRRWPVDLKVNAGEYRPAEVDVRSRPEVVVDTAGHVTVIWRGETGDGVDLYARRFSADGVPDWPADLALNAHLVTLPGRFQDRICAAVADDTLTVAIALFQDGLYGLQVRRLDLQGNDLWNPGTWVSFFPQPTFYGNPSLALDGAGGVVVAWEQDSGLRDIYAQRLNAQGEPVWPENVRLNDYLAWPLHSALSARIDGSLVAVWNDERFGDNNVYARRFDLDGSPVWTRDVPLVSAESYFYRSGSAESRTMDDTSTNIPQAGLIVSQTLNGGSATYSLSNNGGETWEQVAAGALHAFDSVGSDLRWKVSLGSSSDLRHTPVVHNLALRYGPDVIGDAYEPDDACAEAQAVFTDGSVQPRVFYERGDVDWVTFSARAGTTYVLQGSSPGDGVDLVPELRGACDQAAFSAPDQDLGGGFRLVWTCAASGVYHLQIKNHDPDVYGPEASYDLSVRRQATVGVAIIAAGKRDEQEKLLPNFTYVANMAYRAFQAGGYSSDRIYYLHPDPSTDADGDGNPDVDALSNSAKLQEAITGWAAGYAGPGVPFYLYMVDHGGGDVFYINTWKDTVTAAELRGWLAQFETATACDEVNVIMEACESGSFIIPPHQLAQVGRVVIGSAQAGHAAYGPSDGQGAYFSNSFLSQLGTGGNLWSAYELARNTLLEMKEILNYQQPWLDDDGDGVPSFRDGAVAQQRGLRGEFGSSVPWVSDVSPEQRIDTYTAVITATVYDDGPLAEVWVEVYAPSYRPPTDPASVQVVEVPQVRLSRIADNQYRGMYGGFTEVGLYRLAVYARDVQGYHSLPSLTSVRTGYSLYLPLLGWER